MRIINVQDADLTIESLRPKFDNSAKNKVLSIIKDVQKRKDKAVKYYESKFSGSKITTLKIPNQEIKSAYSRVNKDQIEAIRIAKTRLEKSEKVVRKQLSDIYTSFDGVKINKTFSPIDSVGCYVPGGKARYPSTVIMSVIPAKIAGVKKITVVSPSGENGEIDPLTLVAADLCGADAVYRIGGAQAIAALVYGTESVPQVDKIVGPGGMFVTIAKSLLSNIVSIDMVAGPTEIAIIADASSNPEFIALDLISQAEHSVDTMCCLITNSKSLISDVTKSLEFHIKKIKRSVIVEQSLRTNGFIVMCKTEKQMIDFANKLAPEHLEVMTKNPQKISKQIKCAGLTLLGNYTPSSASDYLLGSNHILPTNRFGRVRGSLGVLDFMRIQTHVETSKKSLKNISKYMKAFTEAEGLPNHYEAVKSRV